MTSDTIAGSPMSSSVWFRVYALATIGVAAAASVWSVAGRTWS
ncbi:MAG: hypothetical protein AABO58_12895 [Acidobacteriota bacterium]